MTYKLKIAEQDFEIDVISISDGIAHMTVNNTPYEVNIEIIAEPSTEPAAQQAQPAAPSTPQPQPPPQAVPLARPRAAGAGAVTAPIPGMLLQIKVSVGDTVRADQIICAWGAHGEHLDRRGQPRVGRHAPGGVVPDLFRLASFHSKV